MIKDNNKKLILIFFCHSVKVGQLCLTLRYPMDYTVHGILQARILEWVAFPFSRGSTQLRDWTQVSCIAGRFFTSWATREAQDWSGYLFGKTQRFAMRNGSGGVGAILFPALWFHIATAFWAASEMNLALRRRSRDEGGASQAAWVVENPPANAGEVRDTGSGRSPGGGRGNPLQYSRLENPVDRGTWWVTGL